MPKTTENFFEIVTGHFIRFTGKRYANETPCESLHPAFFHCNISLKSAFFSFGQNSTYGIEVLIIIKQKKAVYHEIGRP